MSVGLRLTTMRIIHSWCENYHMTAAFFLTSALPDQKSLQMNVCSEEWCLQQNISSLTLSHGLSTGGGLDKLRLRQGQQGWQLSSSKILKQ